MIHNMPQITEFDHLKHQQSFSLEEAPSRMHLRTFIENCMDGYLYTYLSKNENFKRLFTSLRRNAKTHDFDREIFERFNIQNISCIRISKDNYDKWISSNLNTKQKVCNIVNRIFHHDEVNNVYYTLPLSAETDNQALSSISRKLHKFKQQISLKIVNGQSRIEISAEAYHTIPKKENTTIGQNAGIKPHKQLRVTERKFTLDEASGYYSVEPYAGEKIKALSLALRESARRKHLDPNIFQLVSKDNRKYYQIKKEDYDKWIKLQNADIKRQYLPASKREIINLNGEFQLKLKKGEFAYAIHKEFRKYLNSKKLDHLIKEFILNVESNTVTVTAQGKEAWDIYISSLNGKAFLRKNKGRTKQLNTVSAPRKCKTAKLGSHYHRVFTECESYFYTLPREGEKIKVILSNLNIHSRSKLNRHIFKLKNDQIRVTKEDYAEWKLHDTRTAKHTSSSHATATCKPRSIRNTHKYIAKKYLDEATSIVIPASNNEKQRAEGTTIHFKPVKELLTERAVTLKQKRIELNSGEHHFKVKIAYHGGEFKLNHIDHHVIFVRAGRKLNANIPCFESTEKNYLIMLMMSQSEFNEACDDNPDFLWHLPSNVQLLIIGNSKMSKTNTIPTEAELRTSNIKRKVALLLAEHFSISDYILMDDNIDSFSISNKIAAQITPDIFMGIFRNTRELPEYQDKLKPVCITTGTYAPHKNIPHPLSADTLQPLNPVFGSKMMYIHSEDIISLAYAKNIALVDLCSFHDLHWGEDYFWQCALGILTNDDRSFLGRLPYRVGYLERANTHQNATLSLPHFKKANQWIRSFDEIINHPALSRFQRAIAFEMKQIVEFEIERIKRQEITEANTETPLTIDKPQATLENALDEAVDNSDGNLSVPIQEALFTEQNDTKASPEPLLKPISAAFEYHKMKQKGAEFGKSLALTGFQLNLQKLNISAARFTSNPIELETFIQSAKKMHEEIYGAMSDEQRAVLKGEYHAKMCVNRYHSKIIESDFNNMANQQGEHKQSYLDGFYKTIKQLGAPRVFFVENNCPKP